MNLSWILAGVFVVISLVLFIILQKSRANNSKYIDAKNKAQEELKVAKAEFNLKYSGFQTELNRGMVLHEDEVKNLKHLQKIELERVKEGYKHSVSGFKANITRLNNQLEREKEALRKQIVIFNKYKEEQDEKTEVAEAIVAGDSDIVDDILSNGPRS